MFPSANIAKTSLSALIATKEAIPAPASHEPEIFLVTCQPSIIPLNIRAGIASSFLLAMIDGGYLDVKSHKSKTTQKRANACQKSGPGVWPAARKLFFGLTLFAYCLFFSGAHYLAMLGLWSFLCLRQKGLGLRGQERGEHEMK
jgi:hypothetical protein